MYAQLAATTPTYGNLHAIIPFVCKQLHLNTKRQLVIASLHLADYYDLYYNIGVNEFLYSVKMMAEAEEFVISTTRLELHPVHPKLADEFNKLILDTFDTLCK